MSSKFSDDVPPIEAYEQDRVVVALPSKAKPRPAQFPVTWVSDAVLSLDAKPVLKGLIEYGAFVVVYGPSGSGKSFFTADLMQHIATGATWRGKRVTRGLVVYVAAEAGASILKRFVAWRDNVLGEAAERVPIAVITKAADLLHGTDFPALMERIEALQIECGLLVSAVVFDTLSRSMPGGDENKSEDMTSVISAADTLRDRFNCATVFVHHSGKDVDRGARGHSSLFAAADLVLQVSDHVATVTKIRDGVGGDKFPFKLNPVAIGQDSDGDDVTTCLLEHSDVIQAKSVAEPLGKNQKLAIKELRAITADRGEALPETSEIPRGARGVKYADLEGRVIAKMPGLQAFRARARLSDAVIALQASGHCGVQGEWIWLT